MSLLTPKRNVTYFERFRMGIDLGSMPRGAALPDECYWVPWNDNLLDSHAEALFASFQGELDAVVFPSLGDRRGCCRLMSEIHQKPGFLPGATWLLAGPAGARGSIQGIRERRGLGSIPGVGWAESSRPTIPLARACFRESFSSGLVPAALSEKSPRICKNSGGVSPAPGTYR